MKIGGMGEQAIKVQFWELRRLHEIPETVEILAVLPDLPRKVELAYVDGGNPRRPVPIQIYNEPLRSEWIPHPKPLTINARCLYIHVQHRYCFRGTEQGSPLVIEELDEFLKRFKDIEQDEFSKLGVKVADAFLDGAMHSWVDDDV